MILTSRLRVLALLCLPVLSSAITAVETDSSDDEQKELAQLLALLDEQTTIATRTRLNADYVPGMVTVLHGDKLEGSGVRNVWEALARVPGIELSVDESGNKQIVVRGFGRTYASGNIKILLNGVAMNSAQTAYALPVLSLPVEQVERIEIIRGPGSVIHGEFAYTGVVNVITRQEGNRLYTRVGDNAYLGGGAQISHRTDDGAFTIDLNLAGWQGDGADITTGNDALHGVDESWCGPNGVAPCSSYSNAPGPSNEAEQGRSVILSSRYRDFTLLAQWLEEGNGDHFGINEFLPPDDKHIVTRDTQQTIEIRQGFEPAKKVKGELYFGWQENHERKDDLFIGNVGVIDADCLNDPYIACATGEAPFVVDSRYREKRLSGGADLYMNAAEQHKLLFGYGIAWIETTSSELRWGQQDGALTDEEPIISEGMDRHITNLTLQDEYRADDALTITAGLRYDEYSDVGVSTTPRLAAVWRLSREHILKAQYAEAFRPPTFYEISGALGDIKPSTSRSMELGYIHKGVDSEWRLNLFRSHLKDLIVFHEDPIDWWNSGFINADDAHLYGAELEWDQRLHRDFDFATNLSYLQSKDNNTGESIAGSSDWLANIDFNYHPGSDVLLNLHYRYVGATYREYSDDRPKLEDYATMDATLSLMNLWNNGLTLRLGVTNLQDTAVRYPAPANTYPDDRPRAGRQWWANLTYPL